MFDKISYFLRYLSNKFLKQKCPPHVTLRNYLPEDKKIPSMNNKSMPRQRPRLFNS